ncbi:hypothetical protein X975_11206, partial [Stegodyphus mimosarum]
MFHQENLLIQSLQEPINTEKNIRPISLNWIRGHTSIIVNEAADTEAKDATLKDMIDIYLPRFAIKNKISKQVLIKWQKRWDEADTGRLTHEYFSQAFPKKNPPSTVSNKSREVSILFPAILKKKCKMWWRNTNASSRYLTLRQYPLL